MKYFDMQYLADKKRMLLHQILNAKTYLHNSILDIKYLHVNIIADRTKRLLYYVKCCNFASKKPHEWEIP